MSSPLARRHVDPSSLSVMLARLGAAAREVGLPERASRRFTNGDPLLGDQAAVGVDALLARVARGRGALDEALGERLAALAVGDRVLRLGYSGLGDYAREVLGVAARTAQQMMRLARELQDRPLLREAVRRGEVSGRRAVAVLPLAVGDAEAAWVERARRSTVRELEAAVRQERRRSPGAPEDAGVTAPGQAASGMADDDRWEGTTLPVSPGTRERLDEALHLAGDLLGPTSPSWDRLEVVCQEFLGTHPPEAVESGGEPSGGGPVRGAGCEPLDDDWLEGMKAGLEEEMLRWSALDDVEPVEAPPLGEDAADPWRLDASLRELVALRDRWDELVGHLGLVVQVGGLWRAMGFATFGHYCEERLGLSARAVEQRVWLERRMYDFPELREALRSGRLSYEKARIVAREAEPYTIAACIEYAAGKTCIALRREVETQEETQMRAQGLVRLRMPERVARLLDDAFRGARRAALRAGCGPIGADECLFLLSDHFVRTWGHVLRRRTTPSRRAVERDRGLCQVPGCSRPAVHGHHIQFRSRGGGDDAGNLVGVCAAHHLVCIHHGWVRVSGTAPDGLVWELGERREAARA